MLMRCSACDQENPATNLFCSKCASSLAKEQSRANRNNRVYLPPQTDLDKPRKKKDKSHGGLWLVAILVIAIGVWLVLYG